MYHSEQGEYVFTNKKGEEIHRAQTLGVLIDVESNVLLKVGPAESVQRLHGHLRKTYVDRGFPEIADHLQCYTGPFPIDEVNRLIEVTGYAQTFVQNIGLDVDVMPDAEPAMQTRLRPLPT